MGCEIFEKNLKAMEKWYAPFADMIREKKDIEDDTEVSVHQSEDGETIFQAQREERRLYLNGGRNAKAPIRMWLERLGKIRKYAPVFLFGIGSGMYLKALVKNTEKEVNIVAYEPSLQIFLTLLHEVDVSEEIEDRPIAFIVDGLNTEDFEPVVRNVLVLENIELFKEEIHPNYKVWYADKLTEKVRQLQRIAEFIIVNANTEQRFSTAMADNILHNMKYLCEGYHAKIFTEAVDYQDVAILVSAGPSLNKNIHELKKAKNKAFILAVDTAMKPLLKAGIKPDAFITIDAKKPVDLVDMEEARDIPVIAPVDANYKLIRRQTGKKIFWNDGYAMPYQIYAMNGKTFPGVDFGGSVACCGFSMLFKMGFHTIILVGQDLAFSDNKSHADGTFQEKMPEEDTERMMTVKGNYVDKIPTRGDFRMYLEWFRDYIKGAKKHRGVRVVNATEGGAYIEGTELCALRDIIAEVCHEKVYFAEKIDRMEPEFSQEEHAKIVEYLHRMPEEYEEKKKNAALLQKAYQHLGKLMKSGKIEQKGILKLLKRIKKLTRKCQEREAYQLIDTTMATAEYMLRTEYYYEQENTVAELKETARKGSLYSQILQECAELLKKMSEDTLLTIT